MNGWRLLFYVIIATMGFRLVRGVFVSDEQATRVERSVPSPVTEAVAAEPAPVVAQEPEPEPEPEKVNVWSGSCYAQGVKIWSGFATEVDGNSSNDTNFIDEAGRSKVDIDGEHVCVWSFHKERVK